MKVKIGITSVFLLVVTLWLVSWILLYHYVDGPSTRGQFGDMFGAVNSLFSGLAFAGLLVNIWMQREELKLQREEMAAQRAEMAASRKFLGEQATAQQLQISAAIASIRVAGVEAEIESIRIAAENLQPGFRNDHARMVADMASKIEQLARGLEGEALGK